MKNFFRTIYETCKMKNPITHYCYRGRVIEYGLEWVGDFYIRKRGNPMNGIFFPSEILYGCQKPYYCKVMKISDVQYNKDGLI